MGEGEGEGEGWAGDGDVHVEGVISTFVPLENCGGVD